MNPREIRKAGRVSQEALGRMVGLSQCSVSTWERGLRRLSPTVETRVIEALTVLAAEREAADAAARESAALTEIGRRAVKEKTNDQN